MVTRIIFLISAFASMPAMGQQLILPDSVQSNFTAQANKLSQEQFLLVTDRPFYLAGETLYFSVIGYSPKEESFDTFSRYLYIELLDETGDAVDQRVIQLKEGMGQGMIEIPPLMSTGNYALIGYTNWMKNNRLDQMASTQVSIVNAFLAPQSAQTDQAPKGPSITCSMLPDAPVTGVPLHVSVALSGIPVVARDLKLRVQNQLGAITEQVAPDTQGRAVVTYVPSDTLRYEVLALSGNKVLARKSLPMGKSRGVSLLAQQSHEKITFLIYLQGGVGVDEIQISQSQQVIASQPLLENEKAQKLEVGRSDLQYGQATISIVNKEGEVMYKGFFVNRPVQLNEMELTIEKDRLLPGKPLVVRAAATQILGDEGDLPMRWVATAYRAKENEEMSVLQHWYNTYSKVGASSKKDEQKPLFLFSTNRINPLPVGETYLPEHLFRILSFSSPEYRAAADTQPVYLAQVGDASGLQFLNVKNTQERLPLVNYNEEQPLIFASTDTSGLAFSFDVRDPFMGTYVQLPAGLFRLDSSYFDYLNDLSVNAQIQFRMRQSNNTKDSSSQKVPIYGKPDQTYRLDDYVRFPVTEEIFREFIPGVQVRRRGGRPYVFVYDNYTRFFFQEEPLILLDGVPIPSSVELMKIDPLKIESIDVVTHIFILNGQLHQGVISLWSYDRDAKAANFDKWSRPIDYPGVHQFPLEEIKAQWTQHKKKETQPRFKNLLYWDPTLAGTASEPVEISFLTGDAPGTYQIEILGIRSDGEIYFGSERFRVEVPQRQ